MGIKTYMVYSRKCILVYKRDMALTVIFISRKKQTKEVMILNIVLFHTHEREKKKNKRNL
ncbi:hypothetical protein KFK09_012585 [Dendrobium nobile]|uniref:Uncharacterized protein n=1 Tax=Dendrobium nobile TaxID=94219 RepID=A0A8T3BJC8_DENNO|nr:hypothetical protein KFK09_012585 [Dendrobium nobile]